MGVVAGWAEAEQAGRSAGELGRSEVRRWLAGREAVRWAERERGRRAGCVGAGRAEACWAAMCWACAGGEELGPGGRSRVGPVWAGSQVWFWVELIWFLGCWARLGFLFPSLFSISISNSNQTI